MPGPPYPLEDIREFLIRRPWLHDFKLIWGTRHSDLVSDDEFEQLRTRTVTLSDKRVSYLRAFIDGYKSAKG